MIAASLKLSRFILIVFSATWFAHGTERPLEGKEIFQQRCAKCHGREGQGVKSKYNDRLEGNLTLSKLTRYIERNMPDDDPGSCTGKQAEAVARYVHESFYSRAARARKHPARIELVRLTNKQYLTSVADLLGHFTGAEQPPATNHGLKATYHNSRHLDEKTAFERVDPRIEFDWAEASPDKEHGTNEFSIEWRGSLIADETGEFEFMVNTPNGVRFWLNDPDEPAIDAWVSSGQATEHCVTMRLLGGRVYPIKLNLFKYKDKRASISLEWKPPHGTQRVIPARNLLTSPSNPTFVVSTSFPADDSSLGYERGAGISKAWDEATTQAAIEVAGYVVSKLDTLSHSKPMDKNRPEKVKAFSEELVATAFRRPLTEEQKRVLIANQFRKTAKTDDALKRVVVLALKSPEFLYVGLNREHLDQFDIAERLSFTLWDSLPDRDLRKVAVEGRLKTEAQIAGQVQRMLTDERTRAKVQQFLQHWLQMDRTEPVPKDAALFPGFKPEIIADLRTSLNVFLEDTVWSGTADYRNLLLADYLSLNARLAEFYGATSNRVGELARLNEGTQGEFDNDDFVRVRLEGEQRSGVLTHPYLLSAFSYQKLTSPIHRGVFLTRNIVGRSLKPPPMAMNFNDGEFAPSLTMREKVTQLTKPQACQSCHSVINPLGFSLESFDAVGRFRNLENDQPVNASSEYVSDDGETVRLSSARDIAEFAVRSDQAQNAFIEQMFHFMVKQPIGAFGPDVTDKLRTGFVASEFNVQRLLSEIATIAAGGPELTERAGGRLRPVTASPATSGR
jgi:cytochrome c553